jgi:hypothetical protein
MDNDRLPAIFAIIIVGVAFVIFIGIITSLLLSPPIADINTPCQTDSQCPSSQSCDTTLSVCRVKDGNKCYTNDDCGSSSICNQNVCVAVSLEPLRSPLMNRPRRVSEGLSLVPIVGLGETSSTPTHPEPFPETLPTAPFGVPVPIPPPIVVPIPYHISSPRQIFLPALQPFIPLPPLPLTAEYTEEKEIPAPQVVISSYVPLPNRSYQPPPQTHRVAPPMTHVMSGSLSDDDEDGGRDTFIEGVDYYPEIDESIDVLTYSKDVIMVMRGGRDILRVSAHQERVPGTVMDHRESLDGEMQWSISSSIAIEKMEKHGTHIYALSKGSLYILQQETYDRDRWEWTVSEWAPSNIVHMSSTLDGRHIWIQTDEGKGSLYDIDHNIIHTSTLPPNTLRRYGYTYQSYVDIDVESCISTTSIIDIHERHNDVCWGALTYGDDLISIGKQDIDEFKDIRFINWEPRYLLRHNR